MLHLLTCAFAQTAKWSTQLNIQEAARHALHSNLHSFSDQMQQVEEHVVDGKQMQLLVHRKGATRAFPPHHPLIPVDYQFTGQPVLIGGTMGTCSYVLTGTWTSAHLTAFSPACKAAPVH